MFYTMKIQKCHLTWFLKKKKVIQVDITSIVIFIWTDKNSDKFDQGQLASGGSGNQSNFECILSCFLSQKEKKKPFPLIKNSHSYLKVVFNFYISFYEIYWGFQTLKCMRTSRELVKSTSECSIPFSQWMLDGPSNLHLKKYSRYADASVQWNLS